MGEGGAGLLVLVLALVLLAALGTLGGLYLLARYWKQEALKELKLLRGELRRLQTERKALDQVARNHSPDDPEPFGSQAVRLEGMMAQAGEQIEALEYRLVGLQERFHALAHDPWRSMLGAPYFWNTLRKEAGGVREDLQQGQEELAAAAAFEKKFGRIGWEVALQARQVGQLHRQSGLLIEQLKERKVHGEALDAAGGQHEQIGTELARLPAYLFSGDEAAVLGQAEKQRIIETHQALEGIRPRAEALLAQAQDWDAGFNSAHDKVAVMRRILLEEEQTLDSLPKGLDVAAYRTQLAQLKQVSDSLSATLSRLEIDNMGMVAEEAGRITQIAREADGQLRQARRKQAELEEAAEALGGDLKNLSLQLAALNAATTHPVVWEHSLEALTHLNRRFKPLHSTRKSRSPDKVEEDLALATVLVAEYKELAAHCAQVEAAHSELAALVAGEQLTGLPDWLEGARSVAERARGYAPENWTRSDSVSSLPDELEALQDQARRLLPSGASEALHEEEVAARLDEVRHLADSYQRLQTRLGKVEAHLGELQAQEEQARRSLDDALAALNQIAFIVRSNPFLGQVAANDLAGLQGSLQSQLNEIGQRQRGRLDKKASQAASSVERVVQTANRWLDQLGQDIQTQTQKLSAALAELDAIARLEDPPLDEARRLLSQAPSFGVGGFAGKARYGLPELVAELKRRSDYWQSCTAGLKSLQEVAQEVGASFQAASQNRQRARELLVEGTAARQKRAWPPTSVSLEEERRELDALEAQWGTLKDKTTRAISLVYQLGDLSAGYKTLAEKARQASALGVKEGRQVEEVEGELDELAHRWEANIESCRDAPAAIQEIRDLLAEMQDERLQIKRQYQQGGRNFDQSLQSLKNLERKAQYFQVALDADHAIDANGRVIRRR